MNSKLKTKGALLVGPVIAHKKVITGDKLGVVPDNRERLLKLALNYRLRSHTDGWFVDGQRHRSQIWEFGIAKLGVTVVGSRLVQKCLRAEPWLRPKCLGDSEANFYCDWSDANLSNLVMLLKIQQRKKRTQLS